MLPVGRDRELQELDALLDGGDSRPTVLVLAGEAGIGKSTLWDEGVARAESRGRRLLTSHPAEAEAPLSYAGLADLFAGLPTELLERLPEPQRQAVAAALLLEPAPPRGIDRRAVAAGVLGVVRAVAAGGPVLLAIDDAQWLDEASALAIEFAIRRLTSEPVSVLIAVRSGAKIAHRLSRLSGNASHLEVTPLSVSSLHVLFKAQLGHSFPRPALVRITQAVGGNPFYALEVARALERSTASGTTIPIPTNLQELVEERLRRLPEDAQDALLTASALGQPTSEHVDVSALQPAETAGLVTTSGDRVRFTHPIFASVTYGRAGDAARRATHRRLAMVVADPEERARHLALGSEVADPAVAHALELASDRAARRGAAVAAADLARLALHATPAELADDRARRGSLLGNLLYRAGDLTAAALAFETVRDESPPGPIRSSALVDLGGIYALVGRHDEGAALIDQAIVDFDDPLLAARAHGRRAWISWRDPETVVAHCRSVLDLITEEQDPGLYSFALQHLACGLLFAGESAEHDLIERSLPGQEHADEWTISAIGPGWPGYFDDVETAYSRRHEALARAEAEGNESERQAQLAFVGLLELGRGNPHRAVELASESLELAEQIEQEGMACVARYVLALSELQLGRTVRARTLAETSLDWISTPPHDKSFILAAQAYAVLGAAALAEDATADAERWLSRADDEVSCWPEPAPFFFHADHIEAALAGGHLERAAELLARLELRAERIPRPWTRVMAARSRGLLEAARGDLDAALAFLTDAVVQHQSLRMPLEQARTLLALGIVHRRRREKRLAREALGTAHAIFTELEAPIWAARADGELRRVATRRAAATLTATEEQIAMLAASGLTNRAIADRVFVTPKTVEANLARVYRKLGITARAQLDRALNDRALNDRAHETAS